MSNEDSVLVLDSLRPALPDGYLTLEVTQTIKARREESFSGRTTVQVQGPRFNLLPQDVASVFPAPGGIVHHGSGTPRVIPHVMLTRTTLPWERTPGVKTGDYDHRPWLGLLVMDQAVDKITNQEGPLTQDKPNGLYVVPKGWELTGTFHAPSLPGPGWKAIEATQLMKLSWEWAKTLLPKWEDLHLLAHVRQGKDDAASRSVIVASPNRVTGEMAQAQHQLSAHLVSLENWYQNGSLVKPDPETKPVLLVVLKSWTYSSAQRKGSSIEAIFDSLELGADVLSIKNTPKAEAAAREDTLPEADYFQSRGFAILPHLRRSGGLTMSFYRGPLAPWAGANKVEPSSHLAVRYTEFGLSDISHEAARELGRLMMLHDPRASRELMNWKMHELKKAAQAGLAKPGQVHYVDHLPPKNSQAAHFPEEWFNRLLRLEGIPFGYLVPDERMLPRKTNEETIRFFELERAWMKALAEGAFSVGPGDSGVDAIKEQREKLCDQILCRGFLLRSSIVSDWPQLHFTPEPDAKTHIMRRLSADIELHLFSATVTTVTVALPREALHFEWPPHSGDDRGKTWEEYTKTAHFPSAFANACLHTGREFTLKLV
jgi:hypothetical protein